MLGTLLRVLRLRDRAVPIPIDIAARCHPGGGLWGDGCEMNPLPPFVCLFLFFFFFPEFSLQVNSEQKTVT